MTSKYLSTSLLNSKKKSYLCLSESSVRELTPFFTKWAKVGFFFICMDLKCNKINSYKALSPETALPLSLVLDILFLLL